MGDWDGESCCDELRPESIDSPAKSGCSCCSCAAPCGGGGLIGLKCVSLVTAMFGAEGASWRPVLSVDVLATGAVFERGPANVPAVSAKLYR